MELGEGLRIVETISADADAVVLRVKAKRRAQSGARKVTVGDEEGDGLLTVYRKIDYVRVEPDYTIARVGGNGGPLPPVTAQFESVAYMNGPDDKPETGDDIRIGVVAAEWSTSNFDSIAATMEDAKYAGRINRAGLFTPAGAGPNPERRYATNNAGNLKVKALVRDGDRSVEGTAQLIVTVQRWNDPPIR